MSLHQDQIIFFKTWIHNICITIIFHFEPHFCASISGMGKTCSLYQTCSHSSAFSVWDIDLGFSASCRYWPNLACTTDPGPVICQGWPVEPILWFWIKNYIRGCENQIELKFRRSVLYLKQNIEKMRRFKIWTRSGQQAAEKILILDLIKNQAT